MPRTWFVAFVTMQTVAIAVACAEPASTPNQIISHIPRQSVHSRAIAKIGYSKRRHILEIEFVNGGIYRYFDVPPVVYRQLMSAESKARFYDSNIRRHYRSFPIQSRPKENVPEKSPASAQGYGAPGRE